MRRRVKTFKRIALELKAHAPFTAAGAATGIILMAAIILGDVLPQVKDVSYNVFYVLHPLHVALSALVTTVLYRKYSNAKAWKVVLIGYWGAIGIATLSDSAMPYISEGLLGLTGRQTHIGFIEEPLLTNPAAFIGIAIGYRNPNTHFPHLGHVLISTWASLFHVVMALGMDLSWPTTAAIFGFLFLTVWLPCCTSDIVLPLLLAPEKGSCRACGHHL